MEPILGYRKQEDYQDLNHDDFFEDDWETLEPEYMTKLHEAQRESASSGVEDICGSVQ